MSDKPKTAAEWLGLGDTLAVELAKVLTPGPWKHKGKWFGVGRHHDWRCKACGKSIKYDSLDKNEQQKALIFFDEPCSVPDPIVIDWNTARRFKGQITDKVFDLALSKVMNAQLNNIGIGYYTQYAIHNAHPRHYLIAAALAEGAKS